jgi:hypothetical protein
MEKQINNKNKKTYYKVNTKHSSHCLENCTWSDSSMSETPDEEVDHGSFNFKYPIGL